MLPSHAPERRPGDRASAREYADVLRPPRYQQADKRERGRILAEDKRQLEHLKAAFGGDAPLSQITAARVSEYRG